MTEGESAAGSRPEPASRAAGRVDAAIAQARAALEKGARVAFVDAVESARRALEAQAAPEDGHELAGTWARADGQKVRLVWDASARELTGTFLDPPENPATKLRYQVALHLRREGNKLSGKAVWTDTNPKTETQTPDWWTADALWELEVVEPNKLEGRSEAFVFNRGKVTDRGWVDRELQRVEAPLEVGPALELRALAAEGARRLGASFKRPLKRTDPIQRLVGHESRITSVASSPDGRLGFSGDDRGEIRAWDLATGAALGVLVGHRGRVSGLAVTHDGKRLVSSGKDGTVRQWDVASRSGLSVVDCGSPLNCLALPRGRPGPAVVASDSTVFAVSLEDGAVTRFLGHRRSIEAVAWGTDPNVFFSGGYDGHVIAWDLSRGRPLGALEPQRVLRAYVGGTGLASSQCLAIHGGLLASGGHDGGVRLWNLSTGRLVTLMRETRANAGNSVKSVAFSPDGRFLLVASSYSFADKGPREMRVIDLSTLEDAHRLEGAEVDVPAAVMSEDGYSVLFSAQGDTALRRWLLDWKLSVDPSQAPPAPVPFDARGWGPLPRSEEEEDEEERRRAEERAPVIRERLAMPSLAAADVHDLATDLSSPASTRTGTVADDAAATLSRTAMMLFFQGKPEEALACYDRAVARAKGKEAAELLTLKANLLALFDRNGALAALEKARAIDPGNANAWAVTGALLTDAGQFAGGIQACDKALALDRRQSSAWFSRGVAHARRHEDRKAPGALESWNEAVFCFQNALHLTPEDPATWYQLGVVAHDKLGYPGESLTYFAEAEKHGYGEDAKKARAQIVDDLARRVEDRRTFFEKIRLSKAEKLFLLAEEELATGELKDLFQLSDRAVGLAPDEARYWFQRGRIHDLLGRGTKERGTLAGAWGCFRRAHALDPRNARARVLVASGMRAAGWFEDAWAWIQKVETEVTAADLQLAIQTEVVQALLGLGRFEEALTRAEKALPRFGNDPVFVMIADVCRKHLAAGDQAR